MSAARHKGAMQAALKAYGEGDFQPVFTLLHPDIVWTSQAPPSVFRFGGVHRGQAEAVAGISTIATDYTMHSYEVTELVSEGDVVWMNARLDLTQRRGGTRMTVSLASRWQFQDGKVISLTEYFDTAAVALPQGSIAAKSA